MKEKGFFALFARTKSERDDSEHMVFMRRMGCRNYFKQLRNNLIRAFRVANPPKKVKEPVKKKLTTKTSTPATVQKK